MDLQSYYTVDDDILLHDPLSETSRKERKMLLASAALGIMIAYSGLVPSKVPAFGIEFSSADRVAFMNVIAAIIGYFLLAFVVYGALDLLRLRLAHRQQVVEHLKKIKLRAIERRNADKADEDVDRYEHLDDLLEKERDKDVLVMFFVKPAILVRAIFELVLPVIIGLYGIYAVLSFQPS